MSVLVYCICHETNRKCEQSALINTLDFHTFVIFQFEENNYKKNIQ